MGSLSDIYTIGKDITKLASSVEDKMRIMELVGKAADLEEENRLLRRRVEELSAELARKKRLETIAGATFVLEDDGSRTGPVCKRCYDERDLTVRLVRCPGGARCVNCGEVYPGVDANLDDPKRQSVSW